MEQRNGYTDFCLLDKVDEDSFMNNLKQRFSSDNIYTLIGEQVVSVNPFSKKNLYTPEIMKGYNFKYMYEVPPHIYSLADDTFRQLTKTKANQCVIITGESGAGKTEASKILLAYLASVTSSKGNGHEIMKKLLDSNPVLEAFGNAKTLRNDNSSRFGKFMEILFDGAAVPVGGKITQYLLEKSRVHTRAMNERSFHIFYQLLTQRDKLAALSLESDPLAYSYLRMSQCTSVTTIDDVADFKEVVKSMNSLGWTQEDQETVWKILAAILHIGNIQFEQDTSKTTVDAVVVKNKDLVKTIADLLSCHNAFLERALTTRSITSGVGKRQSNITVLLDEKQAEATRDSLAKHLYDRLFTWVVDKINDCIAVKQGKHKVYVECTIGVLDIYGFEIFENNSFEQFCINWCNEKLQQLFIKLVLKQEQEEYIREGIEWTAIDYFNNEPIIELIEGSPIGLIKLLDEACTVGQSTPDTLSAKLTAGLSKNKNYEGPGTDRTIGRNQFRIKHYAGNVTYDLEHFLYKNKDTLFADLVNAMRTSTNPLMKQLFPVETARSESKRVPLSAGTQFKNAVNELVSKLAACQPHYIRCIKSNDNKKAGVLDEERVRHQVRYLNLTETVRVRRAGFCNRQPFERFLARYKILSPNTWPVWKGSEADGVREIVNSLFTPAEVASELRLGKTKLFIRSAKTLFAFEDKRQVELPKVAIIIQKVWKGYKTRKWYLEELEKLKAERVALEKVLVLKRAAWKIGAAYLRWHTRKHLLKLKNSEFSKPPNYNKGGVMLPLWSFKKSELDTFLEKLHIYWWARKRVTALNVEERALVRQKILTAELFGTGASRKKPWDPQRSFAADYCGEDSSNPRSAQFEVAVQLLFQKYGDTEILFADNVLKINPRGKVQERVIIVTDHNIYKYEPKKYTVRKVGLPLQSITELSCSPKPDTYLVIHMKSPERDLVLDVGLAGVERVSELVAVIYAQVQKLSQQRLPVTFKDSISYNNSRDGKNPGVDNTLIFVANPKPTKGCVFQKKGNVGTVLYTK